jgi:hypothetical protein
MSSPGAISKLSESDWDGLLSRIRSGQCTPFLGAGMSSEKIPLGAEIAQKLALDPRFKYPLADTKDLVKVTQYIALTVDAARPKELVAEIINAAGYPDFQNLDEPHMALAQLPLPLYITTNYDDFMYVALKRTPEKAPQIFINSWHDQGFNARGAAIAESAGTDIDATVSKPAVYYFHGHKDHLDTMVLTEDDYLDFLVRVSRDQALIPPRIQHAIGGTSLLFIGYSLNDTNFRVIFRGLVEQQRSAKKISVTVQVHPGEPRVVDYLTKYFDASGVRVYWGTARDFVTELKTRWNALR